MNREIKFRAWNKKNGIGEPFTLKSISEFDCRKTGCGSHIWQADTVFMQFTGLLDKNGKEIYEGDIVKDRFGRIMKVGHWNYRLCWIAISETNFHHADFYDWVDKDELEYDGTFNPVKTVVEIIGNIYENPELIK